MGELRDAIDYVSTNHPLPRCPHGQALRDHSGEPLAPLCGCGVVPSSPAVDPAVISLVVREVIDLIQDEYEHGAASIEPGIAAILNKHLGAGK
jgi:hypothetical protein